MLKPNNIKRHPEALAEGSMDSSRLFRMTQDEQGGRSMIEMLGVLAVIGVLSVGGIYGYTIAMRSHRANEIVNATSMLYMLGIAQNQGVGDAEMVYSTHFGANAVPSGASEITYNDNKTITLAITDADICNQVKNKLGVKVTAGDCSVSPYTLTITYTDDNGTVNTNTEKGYSCGMNGCSCSYGGTIPSCNPKPACVAAETCYEDWGGWQCTFGGTYPDNCNAAPACADAGLCNGDGCIYGGTYPDNCNAAPACVAAGTCYEIFGGGMECTFGGTYPNNCNPKPVCADAGLCNGEGCIYGGTYPDNCNAAPACVAAGTCHEVWGDMECTFGGTYPNNCNPKPVCADADLCNGEGCIYGGTYPDNCNAAPACIAAETCYESFGGWQCTFGGSYPNCIEEPACIVAGICSKGWDVWECTYGGTYPDNCNSS